jgi:hypothetical protein
MTREIALITQQAEDHYDSNEHDLTGAHRAWYRGAHLRTRGYDRPQTPRAPHESWRSVPLGNARRVYVCGDAGDLGLAPYLVVSPIAVGSYAFALLGYVAAKRRWHGWLRAHLAGQGGSYIAMVTALLVVNWESLTGTRGVASPWAWALPMVVGSPVIAWVTGEVALGRRPKI